MDLCDYLTANSMGNNIVNVKRLIELINIVKQPVNKLQLQFFNY